MWENVVERIVSCGLSGKYFCDCVYSVCSSTEAFFMSLPWPAALKTAEWSNDQRLQGQRLQDWIHCEPELQHSSRQSRLLFFAEIGQKTLHRLFLVVSSMLKRQQFPVALVFFMGRNTSNCRQRLPSSHRKMESKQLTGSELFKAKGCRF